MTKKTEVRIILLMLAGACLLLQVPVQASEIMAREIREAGEAAAEAAAALDFTSDSDAGEADAGDGDNDPASSEASAEKEQESTTWDGPVLTAAAGVVMGPSGKETYYNLDMSGVVAIMRGMGNNDEYWVREDGCKMLGDYIMCAANLDVRPRGSLVESSLGTCIVCDTGGFAYDNPTQLDIATTW